LLNKQAKTCRYWQVLLFLRFYYCLIHSTLMIRFLFFCCLFFLSRVVFATVSLPALFTNQMVLQQESSVVIWGKATPGAEVSLRGSWNNDPVHCRSDRDGNWRATLTTGSYGGPYQLLISDGEELILDNVMLGEVWLCAGQSNMEMPMEGFRAQPVEGANMDILRSANSNIRLLSIPRKASSKPLHNFEGGWQSAGPEQVAQFSAIAYFFGKTIQEIMDVPVGLIDISWGGSCIQAWMSAETSVDFEDKTLPTNDKDIRDPNRTPTALFNGMLHPVIGYGIRGALWYQGETNYAEPDLYEQLLPTMVAEWRKLWGSGDFPFYYAQIAPFDYKVFRKNEIIPRHNSAYLRDAQRKAEAVIPNSRMIVLLDLGHPDNIHPPQKKEVGTRFALTALSETYGLKGFSSRGPVLKDFSVKAGVVTLTFEDDRLGIQTKVKEPKLFEMAGADQRFYPAHAVVRSKSVLLSNPLVPEPVAVRYAFDDYVEAEIFNNAGLPLSSFRTDNW
jgi:sialate O-acetylesterase